jgi:hypothetical protein
MTLETKQEAPELSKPEKGGKEHDLASLVVTLVSRLLTIPVFIICHKNLPNPLWPFHLDRILLFIALIFLVELILKLLKKTIFVGFIVALLMLTLGSLFGKYGFVDLADDYKSLVVSMWDSPHPEKIAIGNLAPFPGKNKIKNAVNYDNPYVRDFALESINKHFKKYQRDSAYRTIIQCFAVFKEINSRWTYVSDPKSEEYFAKASESVTYLSGDCDDHSILMAACIKSIGGTPRLIHTNQHLYPEMLIGSKKDFEKIHYLIKRVLFKEETRGKTLHYHIDENEQVWLNLDYTEKYPGGKFMSPEILGELTL